MRRRHTRVPQPEPEPEPEMSASLQQKIDVSKEMTGLLERRLKEMQDIGNLPRPQLHPAAF